MVVRAIGLWVGFGTVSGCVALEVGGAQADGDTASEDGASGTSAGEATDADTGDPPAGSCEEHPMVLSDATQAGITGVSAMQVLAEVEGSYHGTITWSAEQPTNYVGSTEPTPFTLEIAYEGGEIRNIDAVLVHPCEHNGPCPCEDSLEIDVTWRLVSDDGVLDETWSAPLVHEPSGYFMASDISVSREFQPDETTGSLAAASFALDDGTVLRRLVAQSELDSGAAQGSINAEVELMGFVGYGSIAGFAAVREVDAASCNALDGEQSCAGAGCTAVTGQPVYGNAPECECSAATAFCFAAAPGADPTLTLYTRVVSDAFEDWDEVVALPSLGDPPPAPWRSCTDAPEVPGCSCFADQIPCS